MALLTSICRRLTSLPPLRCGTACGVLALLLVPLPAAPKAEGPQVQALFLLHLAKFVKWPAEAFDSPEAEFVIGVSAGSPLYSPLRRVTLGEQLWGRNILCRPLRGPADLEGCHLVFIESDALPNFVARLPELRNSPTLLVSDAEGFLLLGGHVQFLTRSGRMRLRLAPDHLQDANLHASAQLLRIARSVEPEPATPKRR